METDDEDEATVVDDNDNEQSGHDFFLEKDILLLPAQEQSPCNLCNAQSQFLWYGRRSISKSLRISYNH